MQVIVYYLFVINLCIGINLTSRRADYPLYMGKSGFYSGFH